MMAIGNIEKRGENSYRLVVSGGFDQNGKRKKHTKTVKAKSQREAEKMLSRFVMEIEAEASKGDAAEQNDDITFYDFSVIYLDNYAIPNLSPTTVSEYKRILDKRLIPVLGKRYLKSIKPLDALKIYRDMEKDGSRQDGRPGRCSAKTIHKVHELLRSMLELALRWELIDSNPIAKVIPPKSASREIKCLSLDETKVLLDRIQDEDLLLATFVRIALFTGLRRSELLGLRWGDVDFESRTLNVSSAVVYVPHEGLVRKEPKTTRSKRLVYLTDSLVVEFKLLLTRRNVLFHGAGELTPDEPVFLQPDGTLVGPDTISNKFLTFMRSNPDLPEVSLHGLRHTAATLMLASGVDIETVSRVLGHATSTTTSNFYLHSQDKSKQDAMKILELAVRSNEKER